MNKTLFALGISIIAISCVKDPEPTPDPVPSTKGTNDTLLFGGYNDGADYLESDYAYFLRNTSTGEITVKPTTATAPIIFIGYSSFLDTVNHKYVSFGDGAYNGEYDLKTNTNTVYSTKWSNMYAPVEYQGYFYVIGYGSRLYKMKMGSSAEADTIPNNGALNRDYYAFTGTRVGNKAFWLAEDTITTWEIGSSVFKTIPLSPNGSLRSITRISSTEFISVNTRKTGSSYSWHLVKLTYSGTAFSITDLIPLGLQTTEDPLYSQLESAATYSPSRNLYFFALNNFSSGSNGLPKKSFVYTYDLTKKSLHTQQLDYAVSGIQTIH
ncbi:MAG: hypothetical protein V4616_04625 [Bacteroidota bacterium]